MFPEKLSRLTKKHKVDIGLSFDGDADRVVISDENGNVIDGDKILAIICKYNKKILYLLSRQLVLKCLILLLEIL